MQAAKLIEHPSLSSLLPHCQSYVSKALSARNNNFEATDIEIYSASILEKIAELDSAITSLRMANGFILDLVSASDTASDAYRYHYENFLLRSMGIYDRSSRLVGASLALKPKDYEGLGGNAYVRKYADQGFPKIAAVLVIIENTLKSYRKPRNEIIHSKAFSSREIGLFSAIEFLDFDPPSDIDVRGLMSDYFSVNASEIAVVISDLVKALTKLLDLLAQLYEDANEACTKFSGQN